MFTNISMTGLGGLITIVFTVLRLFGIEVPDEAAAKLTEAVATIIGIALLVYGQLRRKDVEYGIFRK